MPIFDPFIRYAFLDGEVTHQAFHSVSASDPTMLEWLKRNHRAKQPVQCCCGTAGRHPVLHVCILGSTIYLRRSPGTNVEHASTCRHSEAADETSSGGKEHVPGIRRQPDNTFRIALSTDLFPARSDNARDRVETIATSSSAARPDRPAKTYGKSTLLGLLRFLLQEAGCVYWSPRDRGMRSAAGLADRLEAVMKACTTGTANLLACAAPFPQIPGLPALKERIRKSSGGTAKDRELIVIAPLVSVHPPSRPGGQLRLGLGGTVPALWMAPEDWQRAVGSFARFEQRDEYGRFTHHLWAAVTIRDTSTPKYPTYMRATNLAAVALSKEFIPVESSWELEYADHLVAAGRTFEKPLRFDAADEMFPDFVLRDTDRETRIEVLGFNEASYRARIEEKRQLCARAGVHFRVWDAVNRGGFPSLPPIVYRDRSFR